MGYECIIDHPIQGRMLNLTESAKHLGVSRKKFHRIAPPPGYVQLGIYPFWSPRVLDILPKNDDFTVAEVFEKGKACGEYLIHEMVDFEIVKFRNRTIQTWTERLTTPRSKATFILEEYNINVQFRTLHERNTYRDGVLSAIKQYVRRKVLTLTHEKARRYLSLFGRGSYEGLQIGLNTRS